MPNVEPWRERLKYAIARSGQKHSMIAFAAGVTPETLSRVLNSVHQRPSLDTITRIAHAAGESVGWLLGEHGFILSERDKRRLREAAETLLALLR